MLSQPGHASAISEVFTYLIGNQSPLGMKPYIIREEVKRGWWDSALVDELEATVQSPLCSTGTCGLSRAKEMVGLD